MGSACLNVASSRVLMESSKRDRKEIKRIQQRPKCTSAAKNGRGMAHSIDRTFYQVNIM